MKISPKRLKASFYQREDVVKISKELLGKKLVTSFDGVKCVAKIVETEAYRAPDDKACHAYNNRRTKRTETMFAAGGVAYVYLCYGIHHLFNIVTGPPEMAQAVLIRAVEPLENTELMMRRRNLSPLRPQLTAGPGVMTVAMGITTKHNGLSLIDENSPIWLEDAGSNILESDILASPRVGISYAEECALWNWRFRIKASKWTSKAL